MTRSRTAAAIALIAIVLGGVSACGQIGALTLPDDVVDDTDGGDEDSDNANE